MGLSCRVVLSEPLSNRKELLPCPVRFENMVLSIWAISSAIMIRILVGMLSGPEALCGFRFFDHLSRRLIGELIVYPGSSVRRRRSSSVVHNAKTSQKPLG